MFSSNHSSDSSTSSSQNIPPDNKVNSLIELAQRRATLEESKIHNASNESNADIALRLFKKAQECKENKEYEKEKQLYQLAADPPYSSIEAQYWLGLLNSRVASSDDDIHDTTSFAEKNLKDPIAVKYLTLAAVHSPPAQFFLAKHYVWGVGVEKDLKQAMRWVERAIINSKSYLATMEFELLMLCYAKQRGLNVVDIPSFLSLLQDDLWFELQKRIPCNSKLLLLSARFYTESKVGAKEENLKRAKKLLHRAAEQGLPEAQYELGCTYGEDGYQKEARDWFHKAADQGYPDGLYAYGNYYQNGVGVEKNLQEAAKFYHLAASLGSADAQNALGKMYKTGSGVEKDINKAVELFQSASEQRNNDARCNLGVCYENGEGVEKNLKKAIALYEQASSWEYPRAKYHLWKCSDQASRLLLMSAAEGGYPEAQYALAECYETGSIFNKDLMKAIEFYWKAAISGHLQAKAKLRTLPITPDELPFIKDLLTQLLPVSILSQALQLFCPPPAPRPPKKRTESKQPAELSFSSTSSLLLSSLSPSPATLSPSSPVSSSPVPLPSSLSPVALSPASSAPTPSPAALSPASAPSPSPAPLSLPSLSSPAALSPASSAPTLFMQRLEQQAEKFKNQLRTQKQQIEQLQKKLEEKSKAQDEKTNKRKPPKPTKTQNVTTNPKKRRKER